MKKCPVCGDEFQYEYDHTDKLYCYKNGVFIFSYLGGEHVAVDVSE